MGASEEKQPVIFEIYLKQGGFGKKYLDSRELSAFPKEKEVLVGFTSFKVLKGESNFQKDDNGCLIIQLWSTNWYQHTQPPNHIHLYISTFHIHKNLALN